MDCITNVYYRTGPARVLRDSHEELELILLLSGQVHLQWGEENRDVRAPALLVIGNLVEHAVSSPEPYTRYVVTLRPALLPGEKDELFSLFLPQLQVVELGSVAEESRMLFRLLEQEFRAQRLLECMTVLECFLILLKANQPDCFCGTELSVMRVVRSVRTALEQSLDTELDLHRLAEQHFLSYSYLSHRFTELIGCSMGQYRQTYKMRAAAELLSGTELRISEICARLGFCSASNFSRCFRQHYGCTPTEYRRNAQS